MLCLFASRVINNQSYFKNEASAVTNLVSFLCSHGDHLALDTRLSHLHNGTSCVRPHEGQIQRAASFLWNIHELLM